VRRLFRLWPAYAIVLWLYYSVMPVTGLGALWEYIKLTVEGCTDYWWTNLLFINNFIPDGFGTHCFRIGWFLAVDFQLFLFAPLLVYIYYRFPKVITWGIMLALTLISLVIRWVLADHYHYKAVFIHQENIDHFYWERFFTKPYCQWTPYLFGMMCGIMWVNHKQSNTDDVIGNLITGAFRYNRLVACGLFGLGLIAITPLTFGLMDAYAHFDNWNND
jgi:peptidoglycan/LPS O-acetylase OafA/YrhL